MENRQQEFNRLVECVKVLENGLLKFPEFGKQKKYGITQEFNDNEKFEMVINRKGHLNSKNLTYLMHSKKYSGLLVRLDMSGSPHMNIDGNDIPTPHVHIYDEQHANGAIAVPLIDISDYEIVSELHDSLIAFLIYNKVERRDVQIEFSVFDYQN